MTTCDWCEKAFLTKQLWNVEYINNFANVLCDTCVYESSELENFVEAWR
jgi:hypothetical protein